MFITSRAINLVKNKLEIKKKKKTHDFFFNFSSVVIHEHIKSSINCMLIALSNFLNWCK